MNAKPIDELREFHRFVGEKVNAGPDSLTLQDVLDEWHELHPEESSENETLGLSEDDFEAIQEAIDARDAGDNGRPFEEFDREMRAKFNLPPRT
jgi:hypothetical protein